MIEQSGSDYFTSVCSGEQSDIFTISRGITAQPFAARNNAAKASIGDCDLSP
jgi:hypothetical protein